MTEQEFILDFIDKALAEDIGDGDHTSLSTIPESATGKAKLLVKQPGVLAGVELAKMIFQRLDSNLKVESYLKDGDLIKVGDIAFEVFGSCRSILMGERLVLNCMQRLSGIATHTRELVDIIAGTSCKILDTRKTTPNFRYFEKWAVRIGGGDNHRMGLYDMILVKDNHVDFAGGISQAIDAVHVYLDKIQKDIKIEIEVRNLDELNQVLEKGGVHRIMLDNFSPVKMKEAVALINHKYETEASGGITRETLRSYAETGVDFISIGALTHQINSLDLSLKASF